MTFYRTSRKLLAVHTELLLKTLTSTPLASIELTQSVSKALLEHQLIRDRDRRRITSLKNKTKRLESIIARLKG